MKLIRKVLLATAVAASVPALAQMQPSPWYIGAGIGQGHLNASGQDITGLNNATLSTSETSYTVRTGWRFNRNFALELGYYDLGKYAFHGSSGALNIDGEARAKSVGLSLVGIVPIDAFDLYGRIGYARSELKVNASSAVTQTNFNQKDHQNEATYGVGARWNFGGNWGPFVEWMKNDKIKVDSYMVGIDVRF